MTSARLRAAILCEVDLPKAIELSCAFQKSCLPFLRPPKETWHHTVPTCAQLLLDPAPAFLSPSLMFAIGMFPIWPLGPGCQRTSDNGTSHNSIAAGSAPRREVDSQPISQLDRPAVSQRETHTVGFLSVADTGPSSVLVCPQQVGLLGAVCEHVCLSPLPGQRVCVRNSGLNRVRHDTRLVVGTIYICGGVGGHSPYIPMIHTSK